MESIKELSNMLEVYVCTSLSEPEINPRRYRRGMTVSELKNKLEMVTGRSANSMNLSAYDKDKFVAKLDDDDSQIGSYSIENGMQLLVEDPTFQNLDQDSIDGYKMTEEEYDAKQETLKSFLKNNKLGKYNPEYIQQRKQEALEKEKLENAEKQLIDNMKIGQRCCIKLPNKPIQRGTVMYLGQIEEKSGYWVGVKYDEPYGKHDGSINGKRYFETLPKYASFVTPSAVEVGDFPVIDDEL
ncbi:tubulin-folding cofactor B [Daktulosphaira vitifoliae]|uniref:tubulin-folding cofactor B n=1 Tax=Daktulosphaira vitifoliae TaxID=58002 RepID=UPI0021A9F29F|nr:tubulin-folding cofactor B [Daktulosphaira vitifoliae]